MYRKVILAFALILSLLSSQNIDDILKRGIGSSDLSKTKVESILLKQTELDNFENEQEMFVPDLKDKIPDLSDTNVKINQKEEDSFNLLTKEIRQETLEKVADKKADEIDKVINDIDIKKQYFGYNVFKGSSEMTEQLKFESIDPNYVIGPGDEIIIMLWGETEINKKYRVSRDGYLFIPNVGQIFVNSLTLEKLEKKLFNQLKKVYASLDPANNDPTTFFDVSLGPSVLRPLKIFVLGEVMDPGIYYVSSTTSLFSSLYHFNGPDVRGSLRDVKLIRNEKEIASADFYEYLLTGMKKNDQQLQRNDVIFFPPRGKSVKVQGEIYRNLIFELKDEEGLKELINYAGGLKTTTYRPRVRIDRIVPFDELSDINDNKKIVDIDLKQALLSDKEFKIYDGDLITFLKINDNINNIVTVAGNVYRPGSYGLESGMKLLDLIKKSDGLRGDTYMEKAEIIRTYPDSTKSYIQVNLDSVIANKPLHNITLIKNDNIQIFDKFALEYATGVFINGHVKNPGYKPYLKDMTVSDLVFQGGGFKDDTHLNDTYFKRADLIINDMNGNVEKIIPFRLDSVLVGEGISSRKILMGNEIRIYSNAEIFGELSNSVEISGFVMRPGTYKIPKSSLLSDLLFRAGGFDNVQHKNNAFLSRCDIIRKEAEGNKTSVISINLNQVIENNNDYDPIVLPGDRIIFYSKSMFFDESNIEINGVVNNPGFYDYKAGMTLTDLIMEAGGVSNAIGSFVADVYTRDENNAQKMKSKRIFFDNNKDNFIRHNNKNQYFITPNDLITLRENISFRKNFVEITGFVYFPGRYIIKNPQEKVSDIIIRAGGLRPEAYPEASSFIRNGEVVSLSFKRILKNPKSNYNFIVLDGDKIEIKNQPNIIEIIGEVNSPGNYQYFKNKDLDFYIKMAGGYTPNASVYDTYVTYPNGRSSRKNLILNTKVLDGSKIQIPSKEETEPFNFTEYATNITSIYSDFMQAYMMLVLIGNQNQ